MKLNKIILIAVAILMVAILYARDASAGDPHHDHYDYDGGGDSYVTNVDRTGDAEGVALAIAAAQCQFDFGTYSTQGCVSAGSYDNKDAINFGVGKRFGKNRLLLNGSVGIENGKTGVGAAVNWRF